MIMFRGYWYVYYVHANSQDILCQTWLEKNTFKPFNKILISNKNKILRIRKTFIIVADLE